MKLDTGHIPTLTAAVLGYEIPQGTIAYLALDGQRSVAGVLPVNTSLERMRKIFSGLGQVWVQGYGLEGAQQLWDIRAQILQATAPRGIESFGGDDSFELLPFMSVHGSIWRFLDQDRTEPALTLPEGLAQRLGSGPVVNRSESIDRLVHVDVRELASIDVVEAAVEVVVQMEKEHTALVRLQMALTLVDQQFDHLKPTPLARPYVNEPAIVRSRTLLQTMLGDKFLAWQVVNRAIEDPKATAVLVEVARTSPDYLRPHLQTMAGWAMYVTNHDGFGSISAQSVSDYIAPHTSTVREAQALIDMIATYGPNSMEQARQNVAFYAHEQLKQADAQWMDTHQTWIPAPAPQTSSPEGPSM